MKIKKVLNSSVVLATDDACEDFIMLGKGIGYGRKAGENIDYQPSNRVFIPLSNPDAKSMLALFSTIPSMYLDLTQAIIADAEKTLAVKLSSHLYLMLTEHIHFAVERQKKGLIVTNQIFWDIKHFYQKEFAIGLRGLQLAKEILQIDLPEEEAGNIAFHIVNARLDKNHNYDAMRAVKLIRDLSNIVMYGIHIHADLDGPNYSRFITHLQFFAERFYTDKLMSSKDDFLYHQMEVMYPVALSCAEKIRTYIVRNYNSFLPNEEVAYLALHVARLLNEPEE